MCALRYSTHLVMFGWVSQVSCAHQKVVECCVGLPQVLHGVVVATEVGRDAVLEQEGAESLHKF